MTTPLVPTYKGFVGSNLDALLIIEASLNNELPLVSRRPAERERGDLIKSGSVFVFVEKSSEIKRWTDGIAWSASRILGRFLIYRALDKLSDKAEKRKGRKTTKGKESALKVEEKSANHGYVDKYLGFNDRLNYGQDIQFSQYKENLRPYKSLEYPNTGFKNYNVSNATYGNCHGKIIDVSYTPHLQKQSTSKQNPGTLGVGCNSASLLNATSKWPANSVGYAPSNNHSANLGNVNNGTFQSSTQGELIVDTALIKKTISLTIYPDSSDTRDEENKQTVHLISYFSAHDVLTGKILRPTQTELKNVTISSRVWSALKRSSLGGKFPLENEASFYLDSNYQLQNMSILTDPNPEGKRIANRRMNSDSHIDTYGNGPIDFSKSIMAQEPQAIDYTHRNTVQLMDTTKLLHVQPTTPQVNTLEYPSMNKLQNKNDPTNVNFKKRRLLNEPDSGIPDSDVALHYPEALIDQTSYSFANSDSRQNLSPSSSRFSQYTLFSPEAKVPSNGTFSLSQSASSIEKPEGNVSPTMMASSAPKFELPAYMASSLPMYTDNTYISEPCSPNQYGSTMSQSQVHGNQSFYPNPKPLVGQHGTLGSSFSNTQNTRRNQTQGINQNHNQSPASQFYPVNSHYTRSVPAIDSTQNSLQAAENFPPANRNLSNLTPEQTLNNSTSNINCTNLSATDQTPTTMDRKYFSEKTQKEELSSLKYEPLPSNMSLSSVANASKPNIHADGNEYFQSSKTL